MTNPVVGDVAKLDLLYITCHDIMAYHNIAIQWLVMWQSWICFSYVLLIMSYPVVGDVAKLDIQDMTITVRLFTFLD